MKQNTQNSTYITIRIHKHNNTKHLIYEIKKKHTKYTTRQTSTWELVLTMTTRYVRKTMMKFDWHEHVCL